MSAGETETSPRSEADQFVSEDDRWDLYWHMQVSSLYHLKRERFLDGVDRASKAIGVLGGATAFAQLTSSDPTLGKWAAAAVAVVSTLALVYNPSFTARRHAELARDFKELEGDLVALGTPVRQSPYFQLKARVSRLEAQEPAALGALVTHCHNQLSRAMGREDKVVPLPLHQRWLKNWFDFDQSVGNQEPGPIRRLIASLCNDGDSGKSKPPGQ